MSGKKNIMNKFSIFIFMVSMLQFVSISATPSEVSYIMTKVENPEQIETIALNHNILGELYEKWEFQSVSVNEYGQNSVATAVVRFRVPGEVSPNGVAFDYGVAMKIRNDSLVNSEEIIENALRLKEVVSHIENHKTTRIFRSNAAVSSEYLYWNAGKYIFEIRSDNGDTMVTVTGWPANPNEVYVSTFNFVHPHLVDVLEIFLSNLYPISDILLFRDRVGIGYARKRERLLEISSGKNCYGSNACMTTYHSGQWITAYKLPLNLEWASFPFYADAQKEILYYQLVENDFGCLIDDREISGFAIMCHQQNRLARRIYFMIGCKNDSSKLISVQVARNQEIDPILLQHELSTIDSLLAIFDMSD